MSEIRKAFLEKKPVQGEVPKRPFFPVRKKRDLSHIDATPEGRPVVVIVLWMLFAATFAYVVLFSPYHRVGTVRVSGTRDVSSEEVRAFVLRELSGSYWGFIPKDDYFLVRKDRIRSDLLTEFPKLKDVAISTSFPRRVDVSVTERDRLLLWCSGGPCFLLASDGTPHEARYAEEDANQPFVHSIVDESAEPVTDGATILSGDDMAAYFTLEKAFHDEFSLDPVPVASTPSRVSRELRFTMGEGWDLFVSLSLAPEKTLSALRLLFAKELPPEKRTDLRYVDLRTENRAFYTVKGAPAPVVITADQLAAPVPPKDENKNKK